MNTKKILVLGSNGMLGNTVLKYFDRNSNFNVVCYNTKISSSNVHVKIAEIVNIQADIIINCIGLILQKSKRIDDLYFVNFYFPSLLSAQLDSNTLFVQPSTDCVFKCSEYELFRKSIELPDATDDYGRSKAMTDRFLMQSRKTLILRTSIIGLTNSSGKGLLDWFSNDKRDKIPGFSNHYWNGITVLEWAKICEKLILDNENGLKQIGTASANSKFEILKKFNEIFDINKAVIRTPESKICWKLVSPDIYSQTLEKMLYELKQFYEENC